MSHLLIIFFFRFCFHDVFIYKLYGLSVIGRPYFSLPKVMDYLFTLAKMLFGIDVELADGLAPMFVDLRCSPSCARAGVHGTVSICPPDCFQYKGTLDVFYKIIRQILGTPSMEEIKGMNP